MSGDAAATLVTQRELRRLQALSDQGRGPDWRAAQGGAAFSDQLLCLALVDKPGARQALGQALIDALLDESCQSALWRCGAFSVTDVASGYPAGDPLALLDAALHGPDAASPNCFDGKWPEAAGEIVRELIEDKGEAPALWRRFAARLLQNPND